MSLFDRFAAWLRGPWISRRSTRAMDLDLECTGLENPDETPESISQMIDRVEEEQRGAPFRVVCTRAYADGSQVQTVCRSQEMVEVWAEPYIGREATCALFVGNRCIQRGYLSEERCAEITHELEAISKGEPNR